MARQLPIKKTTSEKSGLIHRLMTLFSKLPWFYNLSIASKLSLGFGLLVFITLMAIGFSYRGGANATNSINRASELRLPVVLALGEAQANLLRMSANVRGYLALGDKQSKADYERYQDAFATNLRQIKVLLPSENQNQLAELEQTFTIWSQLPEKLFDLHDNQIQREPAYRLLTLDGTLLANKIITDLNIMADSEAKSANSNQNLQLFANLAKFQNSFMAMVSSLQSYVNGRDELYKRQYQMNLADNEKFMAEMVAQESLMTTNQLAHWATIQRNRAAFLKLSPQIFDLAESDHWREDLYQFQREAIPLVQKMESSLNELTDHQQALLQFDLATGRTSLENTNRNTFMSGLIALIFGVLLIVSARGNIAAPIQRLKEAAMELAKGDLTVKTIIESGDETGQLAEAINIMTDRLRNLIDTLEERVQGRTQALQTSAEISRNITSILNQDDLLEYIVNRIRSEFDFYHVQVYLVDDESGDLIMVKGSGEVGEKLEAKGHRLREGQGIVGTVAFLNEQFLSNNVDEVLNFMRNPLLLETQSELALPLRKGDKVLGVLDIQSEKVNRFSNDDVALMQSIADQIAVTIANAGVYQDLEEALVHQYDLTMSYSRFVPREILYFLGKKSIVEVKLGDQIQQEMTVLFSDIRSFTSLSEQMTPQENFNFINDYLSRVGPIIRKHNGFIDKYIGDAVMALFPKRAEDAVDAAIAMQNAVGAFNVERVEKGLPAISIAIGLHTGNVMLGTVGEAERMEGTVISDAVNLASRMEGLTKIYKASVVVSEHTLSMLGQGSSQYNVRFLDRVQVKGKKEAVSVFEILDGEPERLIALKLKTRPDFETALFHYQYREFNEAKKCFEKVLAHHPEDEAAALYLHRINYFLEYGVPVDWTGVVVLAEK